MDWKGRFSDPGADNPITVAWSQLRRAPPQRRAVHAHARAGAPRAHLVALLEVLLEVDGVGVVQADILERSARTLLPSSKYSLR